ncbi:MAG TPA: MFS transporter [Microthrixaceae bacterium]|nr:MFS transporter [Microthrixaceae bacterium]
MPPSPPPVDALGLEVQNTRFRPGSPAAALSHFAFRWVYIGTFASNVGTWMQNFTLGALADQLTGKSVFIGVVTFAQLGPMLLLSPIAGVLADTFDRKRLLITAAAVQTLVSLALAWVALADEPSMAAIVGLVAVIGIAGACAGPASAATLPALVGRRDLPGAISLNSAQMNASRVVGPLAAGLLIGVDHASLIFAVNALTYMFVIAAIAIVPFDSKPKATDHESPLARLRVGLTAVRADRVITRVLVTVSLFSLCSLIFVYQMHPFALGDLGGDEHTFTLLFSTFGLGAALGAIAVGTVLARVSRPLLTRVALVGFAFSLGALSVQHRPGPAYFAAFATGWFYFIVITALSTILQERVDDKVRGRVMGLWMMAWAGLVPLGSLIGGGIIDAVGLPSVFLFGGGVALALAFYADLRIPDDTGPIAPPETTLLQE